MNTKRFSLILLLVPLLAVMAFIPGNEDPIDKIIKALASWGKVNPVEKVYLHP
ncbi:MAG: hypothetical protein WKF66_15145 [Pedobacter sp.]